MPPGLARAAAGHLGRPPSRRGPHDDRNFWFFCLEMEAWIRADVSQIERASRASGMKTGRDEIRARFAGSLGVVSAVDPRDKTAKVRVMVSPGRAAEVWYGVAALWDPRRIKEGFEVRVCADVDAIHRASRAAGISEENDSIRAKCAGKAGAVLQYDEADQSAKVRVVPEPGQATICWFPVAAIEPK